MWLQHKSVMWLKKAKTDTPIKVGVFDENYKKYFLDITDLKQFSLTIAKIIAKYAIEWKIYSRRKNLAAVLVIKRNKDYNKNIDLYRGL